MDTKAEYRTLVQNMGKKEFTFLKMQEYGFWPSNLPTPYERQQNETEEDFENRKKLLAELQKLSEQISEAYQEKTEIEKKISHLKKQYEDTWDYEKIRAVVSQEIMKESITQRFVFDLQKFCKFSVCLYDRHLILFQFLHIRLFFC